MQVYSFFPATLAACALASVLTWGAAPARASGQSGPIQFQNASNKCVDVRSSSTANGTVVQLYDCNGTNAQQWSYVNGSLQVLGNKCLDLPNGNTANGTLLQIWDCYQGNTNQQWVISGSQIKFYNTNKCIDLPSGNTADWTQLQIWDCYQGNGNQAWNVTFQGSTNTGGNSGTRPTPTNPNPVNFGPNVYIFDPSMGNIQSTTDGIYQNQQSNQFGTQRYAYLFKPGSYNANINVGFYTTVHGLGSTPDAVTITGGVQSTAAWFSGNATQNFWRGVENLAVVPTVNQSNNIWAVSQATWMRRLHVRGVLSLFDFLYYPGGVNWSSGGFVSDTQVDTQIISGSQQQFLTRNSNLGSWSGGAWNMVFVGDNQTPSGSWPSSPFTVVPRTPVIREKPYLTIDGSGNYAVQVPGLKQNSQGVSWGSNPDPVTTIPISQFYIAQSTTDTADSLNNALQQGYHVIFTPGVYHLNKSLQVTWQNTVLLGLGLATLTPDNGTAALTIADVDGVTVAGLLFDAGPQNSSTLLLAGTNTTSVDHSANPIALFDLSCRVGGAAAAATNTCFTINVNNLLLDNVWLWRADHGDGVGWTNNPAQHGLVVNGANMTAYGLFVEHFENYQTMWNGNGGRTYFYQSEIPYDVPNQGSWKNGSANGFASYKVANGVTSHSAQGMGVYCYFYNGVVLDNAFEAPSGNGISFNHLMTRWLGLASNSAINNIINGTGGAVNNNNMQQDTSY